MYSSKGISPEQTKKVNQMQIIKAKAVTAQTQMKASNKEFKVVKSVEVWGGDVIITFEGGLQEVYGRNENVMVA